MSMKQKNNLVEKIIEEVVRVKWEHQKKEWLEAGFTETETESKKDYHISIMYLQAKRDIRAIESYLEKMQEIATKNARRELLEEVEKIIDKQIYSLEHAIHDTSLGTSAGIGITRRWLNELKKELKTKEQGEL